MIEQMNPPEPQKNGGGRQPALLTNDVVKVLLANPTIWYRIGENTKWISGVKANIESMTQRNISHLADKGKFEITQRKNKTSGKVDIFCRFNPNTMEEE